MADDIVTILRVSTADSANNIAELKKNIQALKSAMDDERATNEQNAEAVELLRENQNKLREAMNATSKSTDDLVYQSKLLVAENGEVNGSYNDLVNTMGELKRAWRSTTDEATRARLGKQINELNDQLKNFDASVGNFQRNVGNYQSALKGLSTSVDGLDKAFKVAKGGLSGLKNGVEAFGKVPAVVLFGLLANAVMTLASNFKSSEEGSEALTASMVNFEPIIRLVKAVVQKLTDVVGQLIIKVSQFLGNNGFLKKLIDGIIGVGNAIVKFVLAPWKAVAEAIKVFQEDGIKGLRRATKAFNDELDKGVAFKTNFQAGGKIAEALVAGYKDKKVGEKLKTEVKKDAFDLKKAIEESFKKNEMRDKIRAEEVAYWANEEKEVTQEIDEAWEETTENVQDYLDEMARAEEENFKKSKKLAEQRVSTLFSVADSTASILGSIADLYESDDKANEKSQKRVKALRIASATIDTISGAISAYMGAVKAYAENPPLGQIVGLAQASAVSAAGSVNIAKLKSTDVSASAGSASSVSVSAPTIPVNVQNVRTLTSASEEDRLNKMASGGRVYILASDIEASRNATRTRVAETSF